MQRHVARPILIRERNNDNRPQLFPSGFGRSVPALKFFSARRCALETNLLRRGEIFSGRVQGCAAAAADKASSRKILFARDFLPARRLQNSCAAKVLERLLAPRNFLSTANNLARKFFLRRNFCTENFRRSKLIPKLIRGKFRGAAPRKSPSSCGRLKPLSNRPEIFQSV